MSSQFLEISKILLKARYLNKWEILFINYLNVKLIDNDSGCILSYRTIQSETDFYPRDVQKSIKGLLDRNIIIREKIKNCYRYNFNSCEDWDLSAPIKEKKVVKDLEIELDDGKSSSQDINIRMDKTMKKKKQPNGYCDWGDIGAKKKREMVDYPDWKPGDKLFYARYVFHDFFKKNKLDVEKISINFGPTSFIVLKSIQNTLHEEAGECCNLMLKSYVDWFSVKYLKRLYEKNYQITIGILSTKKIIAQFVSVFNLKGKNVNEIELCLKQYKEMPKRKKIIVEKEFLIDKESMDESYSAGLPRLLSDYGIVLTINYLNKFSDLTKSEIYEECKYSLKALGSRRESTLVSIIDKTYGLSPYDDDLIGLNWKKDFHDILINALKKTKSKQMAVDLFSSNTYSFLVSGGSNE